MNLVTLNVTYGNEPCDSQAKLSPPFELSDVAVRQGSTLTGQARIDFEMMLSCAIFDEPKCQNCLAKGKRLSAGHC